MKRRCPQEIRSFLQVKEQEQKGKDHGKFEAYV